MQTGIHHPELEGAQPDAEEPPATPRFSPSDLTAAVPPRPTHPELPPTRCLHARRSRAREKGALARVVDPPGCRLQMLTPRCPALVPREATACNHGSALGSRMLPASSCIRCPLGMGRAEPRSHGSSCFSTLRLSLLHARCQLGIACSS